MRGRGLSVFLAAMALCAACTQRKPEARSEPYFSYAEFMYCLDGFQRAGIKPVVKDIEKIRAEEAGENKMRCIFGEHTVIVDKPNDAIAPPA